LKYIDEMLTELRASWKKTENRTDPNNLHVQIGFLHVEPAWIGVGGIGADSIVDWCFTYVTNIDLDWAHEMFPKQYVPHPERFFELINDTYRFNELTPKQIITNMRKKGIL
jgi:hypothetical protein